MYKSLISRTISPCRYPDVNSMDRLEIDEHVIRLLNMASTVWGRKEVRIMRTDELFMLWGMLYNHPVNICYYLLDYLVSLAKNKLDDKCDIVVGGIITFITRKFGVGEKSEVNMIEENIYLNLDTLTSMIFINPHGYTHNFQFEWKVNNANCLIFYLIRI